MRALLSASRQLCRRQPRQDTTALRAICGGQRGKALRGHDDPHGWASLQGVPTDVRRTPADSKMEMTEWVLPSMANDIGAAMGGKVMSWIDICGAMSALQHCNLPMVTVSMDALHFTEPILVGEVVTVSSRITRAFRTSVEVEVRVLAEDLRCEPCVRRECVLAYLTFVAVDREGNRLAVPPLTPVTDEDHAAFEAAQLRRERRLARSQELQRAMEAVAATASSSAGSMPPPVVETAAHGAWQPMRPRPSALSHTQCSNVVFSHHTNPHGTTFGGQIMSWMELAGSICAQRHSRLSVTTAAVDDLVFRGPSFEGEVVVAAANVNRAFNTSMEVGVHLQARNLRSGQQRTIADALLTFVATDRLNRPVPVPPLLPQTAEELARFAAAGQRRAARLRRQETSSPV